MPTRATAARSPRSDVPMAQASGVDMASSTSRAARVPALIRTTLLGDAEAGAVRLTVLRLALPCIGEQILNMTVQLFNTYLVGHLDTPSLTAVGLANNTMMLAQVFIMALATGTTALVARHVGARDLPGASRFMQQSLVMGVAVGTVLLILMAGLSGAAIRFYEPEPDVLAIGERYLRIASLSFTLQGALLVGNAALRGAGDTRTPLYMMLLINAVNMLTSFLLLRGVGPLPALGVYGPAVGSAIALSLGGIVVVALLARGRGGIRLQRDGWTPDLQAIRRVLNIGAPAGGEQLAMRLGQVFFSRVVSGLGTVAYAAHSVATTGQSLSFMPGFGFSVAATTLVGQALGAGKPDEARRSVREAGRLTVLMMGTLGLVLVALAPQIMGIFVPDPEVIRQGIGPNRLQGFIQPILGLMMVYSGALRGAGDTRWTLAITGASIWLVRLPVAYLATGPLSLGLLGAWFGVAMDQTIRGALFFLRFRSGGWSRIKV